MPFLFVKKKKIIILAMWSFATVAMSLDWPVTDTISYLKLKENSLCTTNADWNYTGNRKSGSPLIKYAY